MVDQCWLRSCIIVQLLLAYTLTVACSLAVGALYHIWTIPGKMTALVACPCISPFLDLPDHLFNILFSTISVICSVEIVTMLELPTYLLSLPCFVIRCSYLTRAALACIYRNCRVDYTGNLFRHASLMKPSFPSRF